MVGLVAADSSGRGLNTADSVMMWAAHTLAYFGFLRSGEITATVRSGDGRFRPLMEEDVVFWPCLASPSGMRLFLSTSKTDQYGGGQWITIGVSGHSVCAVAAMRAWWTHLSRSRSCSQVLFHFSDGKPLTRCRLSTHLAALIASAGLNHAGFKGHSYRIGAASDAVRAGVETSVLMLMGRWRSTCFLSYVREQEETLSRTSSRLASTYIGPVDSCRAR